MIRLTILLLGLLSFSCASSQKVIDAKGPVEVSFYQAGQRQFTIVNEAHSNRVELYSKVSDSASTKVATNEIMDALLDRFADNQFFELSTEGDFAAVAEGRALQVRSPDNSVHFFVGKQSPKENWQSFTTCRIAFIDVYNGIYAPQSVENNQGESIFGTRRSR